jgi:hypothetical protein
MICAVMDGGRQCADNVEVVFSESNVVEAQASSVVDSTGPSTTSSTAANSLTLAEKAIAALPPMLGAQASDPKRKARSQDPGWKFGWWPDPAKDFA